jgi:alpha-mannosidase
MAYAHAKETCPTFIGKNGKPYKGIVHHLIEDPLNFRLDNLLFWLDRKQHATADKRQRALKKLVPDGNLYLFSYDHLRTLQDPRITSDEAFQSALEEIAKHVFTIADPNALMDLEISRHQEC